MSVLDKLKGSQSNWVVPRDPDGNPYYTYVKETSVDGKYNYKWIIFGHMDYRPNELEGKPVPVGSLFMPWNDDNSGECYIMREDGWYLYEGSGGGGGEPAEYLKSVVDDPANHTATFTKKDGSTVVIDYGAGSSISEYLKNAEIDTDNNQVVIKDQDGNEAVRFAFIEDISDVATKTELNNEITNRTANFQTLKGAINSEIGNRIAGDDAINEKIPSTASVLNLLVDEATVNQKIAQVDTKLITNNKEPFDDPADLPTTGVEQNDYAYVKKAGETPGKFIFDRYKYDTEDGWQLEFELANELTTEQWRNLNANANSYTFTDEDGVETTHTFLEV